MVGSYSLPLGGKLTLNTVCLFQPHTRTFPPSLRQGSFSASTPLRYLPISRRTRAMRVSTLGNFLWIEQEEVE